MYFWHVSSPYYFYPMNPPTHTTCSVQYTACYCCTDSFMGKLLIPLSYRLSFFFFLFVAGYGKNVYDRRQGQLLPFLAPMTFCVAGVVEGGGTFAQEEGWGQPRCLPGWKLGFHECQMDIFGAVGKARAVFLDQHPLPPAASGARPHFSRPASII